MGITRETRKASHDALDKVTIWQDIINILDNGAKLTAREIATVLHARGRIRQPTRQAVAPRLTELVRIERVKVVGKAHDIESRRKVAVYRLVRS